MAEAGLLLNRALDDSKVHPDKLGAPLVLGEIAYVAWVSAANPTLDVLDQSTAQLVSVNAIGCTLDLTNGTIAAPRDGLYRAKLVLSQVSAASASASDTPPRQSVVAVPERASRMASVRCRFGSIISL